MICERTRTSDISIGFTKWKQILSTICKNPKICEMVIMDFSWVLLHSTLKVLMETDISTYLKTLYKQLCENTGPLPTIILLDKLHLIKIFITAARKHANRETADKFVTVFLKVLSCRNLEAIKQLWRVICQMFGLQKMRQDIFKEVDSVCEKIDQRSSFLVSSGDVFNDEEVEDEEICLNSINGIRRNSPFKKMFESLLDEVLLENEEEAVDIDEEDEDVIRGDNKFYNKKLLSYFLFNYMTLLPLITLAVVPSQYKGKNR